MHLLTTFSDMRFARDMAHCVRRDIVRYAHSDILFAKYLQTREAHITTEGNITREAHITRHRRIELALCSKGHNAFPCRFLSGRVERMLVPDAQKDIYYYRENRQKDRLW